ncbi:MAG: hypothetical protein IJW69_00940 [Clostridia bacterium]|nr:hypothetical protein [Clostridia bacterium]
MNKEKIWESVKKVVWFILNPRLLLCVGIAWLITNGWSYILLGIGTWLEIKWMIAVSGAYLAFLWFPFSPEKIATFAIALALLKILFPNDEKTLAVLKEWHGKAREAFRRRKKEHAKKQQNKNERES